MIWFPQLQEGRGLSGWPTTTTLAPAGCHQQKKNNYIHITSFKISRSINI